MRGGYKIIDFSTPWSIDGGTVKIDGIYEQFENNYHKVVMLTNITIDGVEKNDVFVNVTVNVSTYQFEVYGINFTIASNDLVTFNKA